MSPEDLRSLFPAFERFVWLNTPTIAPAARPVIEALRRALDDWEAGVHSWQAWEAEAYATRGLFAGLVGAPERNVALMGSVAEAAATVAASLPPGRVVVGSREFPSNHFPWLALAERDGFDVVQVRADEHGCVRTQAIVEAIDDGTVLVAVSEVQSSNGFRVHLGPILERCRETGARLFVNLTQALGALRFEAPEADFVTAHGYKWLLGSRGAAWMAAREDRAAELRPHIPSWHSPADPYADYQGGPFRATSGMRGLDANISWLPWIGTRAALELVRSLDAAAVEARCFSLARTFREGAAARGLRLVPEEAPSQIVAVRLPDPDAARAALKSRNVLAAVQGGLLRLGFHAFNDESDVEAGLAALGAS